MVTMLYDYVENLDIRIEGYDLDLCERGTSSGFRRMATVASLHGDDEVGQCPCFRLG